MHQQRLRFGYTLTSDGWTSVQNRPLLNALAVVPAGAEFIKAIDTSGETKSAEFIAEWLDEVLKEQVDPDQCDLVITDGASSCKKAGLLLEQE